MTDAHAPVLVGIDGSDDSIRALRWGMRYARAVGAPVRAVGVLTDDLAASEAADEVEESLLAEARALLDGDGVPSYEVETRTGKPAEQLVRCAEESSVVVMGSRGHSTLSDLVVGSVSQHVARQSPRPVIVVREQAQAQATRVVVGTDGSDGSRPALEWAFAYAEAAGVELAVVYGFQTSASSPAILSGFIPTTVGDEIAVAEDMLKDVVAPYAARFPGVAVTREAITVPASVALAEASETAALVVVGSRGRGAFEGMLLGSVSQGLLHRARCSVAVVR
ncbi:universal stress protein [Mumia sp. zg.B53]|uniref:universal stress protein n=1 Tax=unclassified Mumia TaxID=2621872 RepID=UPI001C6DED03|nr:MULTISPECIES: universal stress protein [unclassified Mumia]MBW9209174.1 universal stress protein [Mumia sp. zg.B21]MBW9213784.1 universal stress protein [Mumia sp. zg.B53]MDD9347364.1 universal stress protein [Mumia sp.]